ncbi:MAG: universal stress protein [Bacteroidales bacterium]|nr:universal stress protein [Bacteroidales bacterium]
MQTILVATDFSGDSVNALEHAILWANRLECHIRLIHVMKNVKFDIPGLFSKSEVKNQDEMHEMLTKIIERFIPYYQVESGRFDFYLTEGKPYQEIIDHALTINARFIVVGTHGVSGFEEYFLGSNAFKVVSKSPIPVLTIRHGYPKVLPLKIIVPIDITSASRQKVPIIAEIAQAFGSVVHVIGVRETDTTEVVYRVGQYVVQVEEFLKLRDIPFESRIISGGNITQLTIQYAKSVDADLISIMTEQTERPENLWLGPYAEQMVNHSPIPILSMEPVALNDSLKL